MSRNILKLHIEHAFPFKMYLGEVWIAEASVNIEIRAKTRIKRARFEFPILKKWP